MEPCRVYRAADVPPGALAGEAVAVLGYGHLGRTVALNLRDSGVKVRIGNRPDEYADQARADGFEVVPIAVAATDDIVWVLLPDEVIPEIFPREIAPSLRAGGPSPSAPATVWPLASPARPKRLTCSWSRRAWLGGRRARCYQTGEGFWACVGVEADRSGRARQRMLGLADALGRAGVRGRRDDRRARRPPSTSSSSRPSGPSSEPRSWSPSRSASRPASRPRRSCWRCTCRARWRRCSGASVRPASSAPSEDHGPTAVFGGITRTLEMDRAEMAARFRAVLEDIRSGAFARRFQKEAEQRLPDARRWPAP